MADMRGTPQSHRQDLYEIRGGRGNESISSPYGREEAGGGMGWGEDMDPDMEGPDCCEGWPGVVRTRISFGCIVTFVGLGLVIWAIAHGADKTIEDSNHFLGNWNVVTMIIMGMLQMVVTPLMMWGAHHRQRSIVGTSAFFLVVTSIYIFLLMLFLFVPSWQEKIADLDGSTSNPCCNGGGGRGAGCPIPNWGEYSAVEPKYTSTGTLGGRPLSRSSNFCQVIIFFLDFGVYDPKFLSLERRGPTIASGFAVSASGKPLFAPYSLLIALAVQLIFLLFTFLTYVYWESPKARRVRAGLPPVTPAKSDRGYYPSPVRSHYNAASPFAGRARAAEQFGVGVVLTTDAVDGSLKVASLIPGGPAERSGRVFEGDEIVTIDAHPVVGLPLNQLAGALLGQEGSVLLLGVRRGGSPKVQNVALIRGASAGGGGGHQRRPVQEADGGAPTLSSSVGYGRDRRSASPPPRHHAENPQPALPAASTSPPSSIFSPSKMEVRPPATTAPASFSPRLSPSPAPGARGISKGVGIEFGGDGGAHHLVSGLVHGGAAEASRRVDVGDAIVEVDGVSVEGMSSTFVSALLNGPPSSTVALTLHKEGPGGRVAHVSLRRGD